MKICIFLTITLFFDDITLLALVATATFFLTLSAKQCGLWTLPFTGFKDNFLPDDCFCRLPISDLRRFTEPGWTEILVKDFLFFTEDCSKMLFPNS